MGSSPFSEMGQSLKRCWPQLFGFTEIDMAVHGVNESELIIESNKTAMAKLLDEMRALDEQLHTLQRSWAGRSLSDTDQLLLKQQWMHLQTERNTMLGLHTRLATENQQALMAKRVYLHKAKEATDSTKLKTHHSFLRKMNNAPMSNVEDFHDELRDAADDLDHWQQNMITAVSPENLDQEFEQFVTDLVPSLHYAPSVATPKGVTGAPLFAPSTSISPIAKPITAAPLYAHHPTPPRPKVMLHS